MLFAYLYHAVLFSSPDNLRLLHTVGRFVSSTNIENAQETTKPIRRNIAQSLEDL